VIQEKLIHRRNELDVIIRKLYEQNALGVVTDERYIVMAQIMRKNKM